MRIRIFASLAAVLAPLTLLTSTSAYAGIITYGDGTCVEYPYSDGYPDGNCGRWEGRDGFTVTADMETWISAGSYSFREDFFVITGTPELDSRHLVVRRDDPFDLLSLNLRLGDGQEPYGCASPVEVRSSRGGFLRVEPHASAPGATCWQYGDQGFDVYPYPWRTSSVSPVFSGYQWQDVDWVYVGFAPSVFSRPRPRITAFRLQSVEYIPEPATLCLIASGLAAAGWRARRRIP